MSLAREVAALTRERDSLLGIVLEAANQAHAHGSNGDVNYEHGVPLLMPTSLAQRLLAGVCVCVCECVCKPIRRMAPKGM